MSRGPATLLLVLAGAALTLAGGVVLYVRDAIVDRDSFSDRAVDALRHDDVRRVVAHEVGSQLAGSVGLELNATPPELEATLERAIATRSFERAFRRAAEETHTQLFESGDDSVFFDVPNASGALASALGTIAPGLADRIPQGADTRLLEIERRNLGMRALRLGDKLGPLGWTLLLLGLVLLGAALATAADRRAALIRIALALGFGSALIVVALLVFEQVLAATAQGSYVLSDEDVGPAVKGVWDAYAGDLVSWAVVCAGLGLGLAAVLAWTGRRSSLTVRGA